MMFSNRCASLIMKIVSKEMISQLYVAVGELDWLKDLIVAKKPLPYARGWCCWFRVLLWSFFRLPLSVFLLDSYGFGIDIFGIYIL